MTNARHTKVSFSVLTVALALTGYGCGEDRGPYTGLSQPHSASLRHAATGPHGARSKFGG